MDLFPRDLIGDHSAINDPLPFLFAQNALRKIDTIHPVEHSQYILYCSLRELQMEHGSGSLEVVAHGLAVGVSPELQGARALGNEFAWSSQILGR